MTDRPVVEMSRQEVVKLVMALEEFRGEYGPGEHELSWRINEVLKAPGDVFVLAARQKLREEAV